jgi:hypothetical protein
MYSHAVIRLWTVITDQTKYHGIASKPYENSPVSPFTVGTRHSGLVSLQMQTCPDLRNSVKDSDSSYYIEFVFPNVWFIMTPSFMQLRVTFSNHWFCNCKPTVNVRFVKLALGSFYGWRVFKIQGYLILHSTVLLYVIFRKSLLQFTTINLLMSMLTFAHCSSLMKFSNDDSFMPT